MLIPKTIFLVLQTLLLVLSLFLRFVSLDPCNFFSQSLRDFQMKLTCSVVSVVLALQSPQFVLNSFLFRVLAPECFFFSECVLGSFLVFCVSLLIELCCQVIAPMAEDSCSLYRFANAQRSSDVNAQIRRKPHRDYNFFSSLENLQDEHREKAGSRFSPNIACQRKEREKIQA